MTSEQLQIFQAVPEVDIPKRDTCACDHSHVPRGSSVGVAGIDLALALTIFAR